MVRKPKEETLADRKRRIHLKIRKAESACMSWRLIKDNNFDAIRRIDNEIEKLITKRERLAGQLAIAPEEHEKAKAKLARCKRELGQETATPIINRAKRLAAQLEMITSGLEGVELTAEQIELLHKVKEAVNL